MGAVLKLVDEEFGKGRSEPVELKLASERTTARDLIARRIADEVAILRRHERDMREAHNHTRSFLVRFDPASPEARLNQPAKTQRLLSRFDLEEEIRAAEGAFLKNAFIMLFDDRQIEDLDEELSVTPTSEMVFLRLVPLKGG
ncbi:MAG: hypothetical protein AAFY84_17465 [Pseudomonadota bacterium]